MSAPESVARPVVSVIIPARNEEACLGKCLQSLVSQAGVPFEIIVVDDHSTDRTAEIASTFDGVRVISAPPLPDAWTGKNNAMFAGARAAAGNWLLFTDADTVHAPGSLARALGEAQYHGAALLSYSPKQEVDGLFAKAVMTVIFAELASTYRPREICDPATPAAAANGQYLLISRESYEAVGGHGSIASDILEDVALARAVKHSGRKIFFRYGGDAVRTHMYRNFDQLREGWTKNLALLFPNTATLAARRFTEFAVMIAAVAAYVTCVFLDNGELGAIFGCVFVAFQLAFQNRVYRAHFDRIASIVSFLGLPIFAYLLLRSRLCYARGNVTWKGRLYSAKPSGTHHPPSLQGHTWSF